MSDKERIDRAPMLGEVPHDHTERVPGCFRCDLTSDELQGLQEVGATGSSELVERIARAIHERWWHWPNGTCEYAELVPEPCVIQAEDYESARAVLAVLDLPEAVTVEEWGVRDDRKDGAPLVGFWSADVKNGEGYARSLADSMRMTLVRRHIGPWEAVGGDDD